MAQLVEWSIPTSKVRSSNPVIKKNIPVDRLLSTVLKRRNQNKERLGMVY